MIQKRVLGVTLLALLPACRRATQQPVSRAAGAQQSAAAIVRPDPPRQVVPVPQIPAKPNILAVVIDTLRFDMTSLAGPGRNSTPNLERARGHGISFARAYSTFDATPESHFSILTGIVQGLYSDADHKEMSLAYQLKTHGYRTFGVAANGNLSQRLIWTLLPFDSYNCLYDEWTKLPDDRKEKYTKEMAQLYAVYGEQPQKIDGSVAFVRASTVLARFDKELRRRSPFFGFLNFMEPHDPYRPSADVYRWRREERNLDHRDVPADFRSRDLPPELQDPSKIADATERARITQWIALAGGRAWSTTYGLGRDALPIYKRRYAAEVRDADRSIGEVFQELDRHGVADNTIVIITSDHGESLGERGLITHSFGNRGDREATHRVPLIIVLPAAYGVRGRDVPVPATIADIAPTIYDLLHIDWDPLAQKTLPGNFGKSLVPYMRPDMAMLGAVAPAAVREWDNISDKERARLKRESQQRLKSLGYIQ